MRSGAGNFVAAAAIIAALVGHGCASGPTGVVDSSGVDLMSAPSVYTLVNLQPDEMRGRLYAVNYQQSGLIPAVRRVAIGTGSVDQRGMGVPTAEIGVIMAR